MTKTALFVHCFIVEELLKQYFGKWVAVVDGQVAAVRDQMRKAMAEAYNKTKSMVMFVSEVGNEKRTLHIRQIAMGHYDRANLIR